VLSAISPPATAARARPRVSKPGPGLDFLAECFDRLLHAVERADLEAVDLVHGVVDVLECALQRFERDRARRGLFVNLGRLVAQHGAGRIDDVGGGLVQRGDLAQHQPLIGHRLGNGHRGAQRADGGGAGAVDALDQLDVVLLDQVEREVALHADRHLGVEILRALADVEQRALADRLGLGRIGCVEVRRLVLELLVERLGDVDHLLEGAHRLP
jgi:hypothetical protein